MVKCAVCKNSVGTVFLDKLDGTYVKKDGKLRAVCSGCQSRGAVL